MADQFPPITSRDNPVFKRARSLQRSSIRNAERAFLVEGTRSIVDALETGASPTLILISTDFADQELEHSILGPQTRHIAPSLLSEIADTVTPQGALAVFPWPSPAPSGANPELVLVVDAIKDPGNLGTLLRSASGAGVNRVLLTPGTVDPYNSKVVRSAMGAHFRLPIERYDPVRVGGPTAGESVVVLSKDAEALSYEHVDLTGPAWIVVGSEIRGPGSDVRKLATVTASIPMALETESLNAAVAGSIMLFEAVRQRRSDVFSTKSPH